jgi:hypothetical protein
MPGRRQAFQSNPNRHIVISNATTKRFSPTITGASRRDLAISERPHARHWHEAGDQRAVCHSDISQAQRVHNQRGWLRKLRRGTLVHLVRGDLNECFAESKRWWSRYV